MKEFIYLFENSLFKTIILISDKKNDEKENSKIVPIFLLIDFYFIFFILPSVYHIEYDKMIFRITFGVELRELKPWLHCTHLKRFPEIVVNNIFLKLYQQQNIIFYLLGL